MEREPALEPLPRPQHGRGRWTSFVADQNDDPEPGGARVRALHEEANPAHRVRVEHDNQTLLIHLSDEDGDGWTIIAVDRKTRRWKVAQQPRKADATQEAYDGLYEG